jgi:hypothetical protein
MTAATRPPFNQETLLSALAFAMMDAQDSFELDLSTLEVVPTSEDQRFVTDRVIADESELDPLPEWVQADIAPTFLSEHHPDRFLPVPGLPPSKWLQWMRRFAVEADDPEVRAALLNALAQEEPGEAFLTELTYHTGYRSRWYAFRDTMACKTAHVWLHRQLAKYEAA